MAIELVEVKIDTNIDRKTVVVFDPEYKQWPWQKSPHNTILSELFPVESLFFGVHHFTLLALNEGLVAPGLKVSDLVRLNPAVFIIDLALMSPCGTNPAITLLKNLESDKRLCEVKRVVITDSRITRQLSQKLARFGILECNVYSWRALASAGEFRRMAKTLV